MDQLWVLKKQGLKSQKALCDLHAQTHQTVVRSQAPKNGDGQSDPKPPSVEH
jgi:hypothetical protein